MRRVIVAILFFALATISCGGKKKAETPPPIDDATATVDPVADAKARAEAEAKAKAEADKLLEAMRQQRGDSPPIEDTPPPAEQPAEQPPAEQPPDPPEPQPNNAPPAPPTPESSSRGW